MLKVVIADDEPFVREGLKSLIDWEKIGVRLVGDFENGKDLIDLGFSGKEIGEIKKDLLDKYLSEEIQNEKEEMLNYVKEKYKK